MNLNNLADYDYDVNGNLRPTGIKHQHYIHHLNLPAMITVSGKRTILYVYDNAGNKIKKTVNETAPTKTTLYHAGFVHENDTLQLLLHEEGRIRLTTMLQMVRGDGNEIGQGDCPESNGLG